MLRPISVRNVSPLSLKKAHEPNSPQVECRLVRILNAFSRKYHPRFKYMQGMNVYLNFIGLVMPELDAFAAFSALITQRIPTYYTNMNGVGHVGSSAAMVLVQRALRVVDTRLFARLAPQLNGEHKFWLHPVCQSLSAGVKPRSECLRLWDVLFALGFHFHVYCVAAQLVMLRHRLMNQEPTALPKNDLSSWPRLRAEAIVSLAMDFKSEVMQKDKHLFSEIERHCVDADCCSKILKDHEFEIASLKDHEIETASSPAAGSRN